MAARYQLISNTPPSIHAFMHPTSTPQPPNTHIDPKPTRTRHTTQDTLPQLQTPNQTHTNTNKPTHPSKMVTLTPDTIDDLIYSARAGELQDLQTDLTTLATQTSTSPAHIIAAAIDTAPQEEGGSGSSLLHYPAANGNLGTYIHPLPFSPGISLRLRRTIY